MNVSLILVCPNASIQARMAKVVAQYKRENIEVVVDSVAAEAFLSQKGAEDRPGQVLVSGDKAVRQWLRNGYNRIKKRCPHRCLGLLPCLGPRCQKFVVDLGTGDCADTWMGVLNIHAFRTEMQSRQAMHAQMMQQVGGAVRPGAAAEQKEVPPS